MGLTCAALFVASAFLAEPEPGAWMARPPHNHDLPEVTITAKGDRVLVEARNLKATANAARYNEELGRLILMGTAKQPASLTRTRGGIATVIAGEAITYFVKTDKFDIVAGTIQAASAQTGNRGYVPAAPSSPTPGGAAAPNIEVTGPSARYVDRPATWDIRVSNPREVPLNNVVVRDQLPPELQFTSATEGGQLVNGEVVWNLGTLQPREEKLLRLATKCASITPRALNVATATADPAIRVQAGAAVEIRGLAAFRLKVEDGDDPVEVGVKTTYKVEVRNQGTLPGNQVQIIANVPKELRILNANGPTTPVIQGQEVIFPPVDSVQPKRSLTYAIEVEALQPGDVRFTAKLFSLTLGKQPVIEQECTTIFAPGASGASAGGLLVAPRIK